MNESPAGLRRRMMDTLPGNPYVVVIPRTTDERRTAAWLADHYEVAVFYTSMGADMSALADAVAGWPGTYRFIIIRHGGELPASWPVRYRSPNTLRLQVRALIRTERA